MSGLRFTRQGRQDLLDIWLHLAPRASEALADQIYDCIDERCQLLRRHPQSGAAPPEIAEGARVLVIERWPALYR